ncbi:MAG: SDR family oxidoreductase [Proteobacteria bacterium]|nr:SDR family oxidoreductase [Pseudomonadota bacterium]HQR02786.1 SDR family NAD(P)-dependent oxidoreductase [Rhodocyclaceae bacterium]
MADRLKNKVAIITGAGSGIGAATARRFAEEGATVILVGRRAEPLQAVAAEIAKAGGRAEPVSADVGDEVAFTRVVQDTATKHGRVDILVNNAVALTAGMIDSTTTADWHANFRVTVDGTFFGVRAAMPIMAKQKAGSIVNISSVCGMLGAPGVAGYSAAKAAVVNFSRVAAMEGAASNVRVNVVVPGVVMTPPTAATLPDEKAHRATANAVPLRRIAEPVELANAILFLASDEASYVTGTSLIVDGGKTAELNTGAARIDDMEF